MARRGGSLITVKARHSSRLALIAAATLAWQAPPAAAQPASCPAPATLVPDLEAAAQRAEGDLPVSVNADRAEYERRSDTYTFTGDVVLERADQTLQSDRLRYHAGTNRVDVEGDVRFQQDAATLNASDGYLFLDENRGELNDVRFKLGPSAHGSAEQVRLRSAGETEFERVRYTACPAGDEDWWLSSRELELDRAEGFGTARNATLRFFGVPLLYTPYISFPIDDRRKTGVLPPRLGYDSNNGLDIAVPYYLNLAPSYDLTLTPRLISQRGLMLETETRLLRPSFATELDFNYLPDDDRFGDARWATGLDLRSRWDSNAYLLAELNRVSDREYLDDFGNDLAVVSQRHLRSQIVAGYRADDWRLQALAQNWQSLEETLAPGERPYRILPRIVADYRPAGAGDLDYGIATEITRFDHPNDDLRVTGIRTDLAASTSYRYERQAYYVVPTVGVRHTRYQLDWPGAGPESPERTLPLASVDSGVFLERDLQIAGRPLLQTLEPRLFYLYVPYRDQDMLPLFDTRRAELTLARLFEPNRFTGPDRIGDANYVAAAVSSRFIDRSSGRELVRAAIGRAFYFDDRDVTIGGQTPEDRRSVSDLLADLRANVGPITLYGDLRYDTHDDSVVRRGARLSYRPGTWKAINLAYRHRASEIGAPLEQTELSAVWPVGSRWLALAGWHYSLRDDLTLERFAGVAYNSCCWTLRSVVREHVTSADDDPSLSIMLQLEFIGLGALGQRLDDFIEEAISGYRFER
jgi:LPS-assembly protein